MAHYRFLLFFSLALLVQTKVLCESQIERRIHTDGSPPLQGEGIAKIRKTGDKVEVTIEGFSLIAKHITVAQKITGIRVGLLSQERLDQGLGARFAKPISKQLDMRGGEKFEPEPFTVSFKGFAKQDLVELQVCVMVLVMTNETHEGMILVHSLDESDRSDFLPDRRKIEKNRQSMAAPLLSGEVKNILKQSDQSGAILADSWTLVEVQYIADLFEIEDQYKNAGNEAGVQAVNAEIDAFGEDGHSEVKNFPMIKRMQDRLLNEKERVAKESLPEIKRFLKAHTRELEKLYERLSEGENQKDAKAVYAELVRIRGVRQALSEQNCWNLLGPNP